MTGRITLTTPQGGKGGASPSHSGIPAFFSASSLLAWMAGSLNGKPCVNARLENLGSMDFDAMQIDFSTITFGPGGASPAHDGHVEDVNDDGFVDMVFHFKTQETGIACGDTDATLVGETFGGIQFTGTDTVRTVGCNGTSNRQYSSTKGVGTMSWIYLLGLSVLGLWRRNR